MNLTLDINTILNGLTLAGILWALRTLSQLDKRQALQEQANATRDQDTAALRARVAAVEAEVQAIKLQVAKALASAGLSDE